MSATPTPPTSQAMPGDSESLPIVNHYNLLVYAFHHTFSHVDGAVLQKRLGKRWEHWWQRLPDHGDHAKNVVSLKEALDDTYFFLPHVREFLFPETVHISGKSTDEQCVNALNLAAKGGFLDRLPSTAVRRFTMCKTLVQAISPVQLSLTEAGRSSSLGGCLINWIDIALFPQNVGFLILNTAVKPTEENRPVTVGTLNEFLYHARLLHPLRIGWSLADWRCGTQQDAPACKARELIDFLLQETTGSTYWRAPKVNPDLESYLLEARRSRHRSKPPQQAYTYTDFGQTYGDTFHLFTYAALDTVTDIPGVTPPVDSSTPFHSETERAIYELMTLTDTRDATFRPHPNALETWRKENCLRLWENWQCALHPDHTVFLGFGNSRWTRESLPHNVLSDYFPLYLLTLFQKIAVSFLFPEVSRRHINLSDNLRQARALWKNFLDFESRYWVTEATRRPQGKLLYAGFQKALDVKTVYDELHTEVEDIQKFYEGRVQREINYAVLFLAVVGLPVGLLGSMYGATVLAKVPKAAWKLAVLHEWPQLGGNLETDKANAVAWVILFAVSGGNLQSVQTGYVAGASAAKVVSAPPLQRGDKFVLIICDILRNVASQRYACPSVH